MKVLGSIILILALVAAVVPQFTDCQAQGRPPLELKNGKTVPMKCHWTAEATLATAGPLFLLGILTITSKRKETLQALSLLGLAAGLFLILLPTALIGVCSMPEMICNSVMKPTLILTGILTIGISGLVLANNLKPETPAAAAAA